MSQQPQQPVFSFVTVPPVLNQQWEQMDTSKPQQIGFIETIEYSDGRKEDFFIFLDPYTQQELRVPVTDRSTPSTPFLLFSPPDGSQQIPQHEQKFAFNTTLSQFRNINLPFELRQQLVESQQKVNNKLQEDKQIAVGTDLLAQIAAQHEVDLSAYAEQHKLTLQANKDKSRRFRESEEVVLRAMLNLFQSKQFASFDEIQQHTNQPKQYLQSIVNQHCEQIPSGENRGKWRLTKK